MRAAFFKALIDKDSTSCLRLSIQVVLLCAHLILGYNFTIIDPSH
jgi:hypothetical protein